MSKVAELFGLPTHGSSDANWAEIVRSQHCPFLLKKCIKTRKSEPSVAIGTCTVRYGKDADDIIICPFRLLERRQIFTDCLHLLTLHEPGNELHIVPELNVPGGSIDYCLASVRRDKVVDICGIELQTMDTTGTVWPERQRFLKSQGIAVKQKAAESTKKFGMNLKMTAKTILVQLHHKVETFEQIGKHLTLVVQTQLLDYMRRSFSFDHLEKARAGDSMHFHGYSLGREDDHLKLRLEERWSTDAAGIAKCLGLQANAKVELAEIMQQVESKLSSNTLLTIAEAPPTPHSLEDKAADPS